MAGTSVSSASAMCAPTHFVGFNNKGQGRIFAQNWMDAENKDLYSEWCKWFDPNLSENVHNWLKLGPAYFTPVPAPVIEEALSHIPSGSRGIVQKLFQLFDRIDDFGHRYHEYSPTRMAWLFCWLGVFSGDVGSIITDGTVAQARLEFLSNNWQDRHFTPFFNIEQAGTALLKQSKKAQLSLRNDENDEKTLKALKMWTSEESVAGSQKAPTMPTHTFLYRLSASEPGAITYQYFNTYSTNESLAKAARYFITAEGKLQSAFSSANVLENIAKVIEYHFGLANEMEKSHNAHTVSGATVTTVTMATMVSLVETGYVDSSLKTPVLWFSWPKE